LRLDQIQQLTRIDALLYGKVMDYSQRDILKWKAHHRNGARHHPQHRSLSTRQQLQVEYLSAKKGQAM